MTPKEKADDLVDKFNNPDRKNYPYVHNAQQCALIAVDEIINSNPIFVISKLEGKDGMHEAYLYWKKVKQEIEKL